ncbi:MAG: ribose transport system permease protein [bacterium]|jgi:ribose transport system permease protein
MQTETPRPESSDTGSASAAVGGSGSGFARSSMHLGLRTIGLPAGVLALIVIFAMQSSVFLTVANFQNVGLQAAALAMIAFGQCFVVLTAGFDLSVGATASLVSVVAAMAMQDFGIVPGVLVGVAAGACVGLVNGLVVARMDVAPFVATLAMLSVATGLGLMLSDGTPVGGLPSGFTALATQQVVGIPVPVVGAVVVFLAGLVTLHGTRVGRHIYAIGGNPDAARLSGIRVAAITTLTYVVCSAFSALGGLVLTARVGSGQPTFAGDLALQSITAVVIGGVSLAGGQGSIVGVAFGVLFVSILANGLNLLGVSSYTQMLVLGVALVVVVVADRRARARRSGR